jgi:hypothetical protein
MALLSRGAWLLPMLLLATLRVTLSQLAIPQGTTISSEQRWFLSDSPVLLEGDLIVARVGVLVIDAGVVVRMSAGATILVQGILRAEGEENFPV